MIMFVAASAKAQSVGQVFTVDDSGDTHDSAPGDRICADSQGKCTLRAAVEESNAERVGRDVIIFNLQAPAIIDLTLGTLVIRGNGLSIVGPGARRLTVQRFTGGTPFRIFHIPESGTQATLRGVTISDGISGQFISGGGIYAGAGTRVHIADAALRNHTGGAGGAIFNEGQMTISRVLMANNAANVDGGAIATTPGSTTRILNTTMTFNSARNGGAIYAEGNLLCVNCTVAGNSASVSAGSIRSGAANEVALLNSIVGSDVSFPIPSLSGSFLSHGNNLITDARGSTGFVNGVKNDQVSDNNVINPLLGPLADNGGQTDTRALMAGSPAIDAGNSCVYLGPCPMFAPQEQVRLIWDQRVNHPRRGGLLSDVDIGAYESGNGGSSGSSSFGMIPIAQGAFLWNSVTVLINVETGERLYRSIGPRGIQRFNNLPSGIVFVVELRTKRAIARTDPFVLAFPD